MSEKAKPKRRRWPWLVLAVLVLGAAAIWRSIDKMAVGTGETRMSPDERYTASATDYGGRDFFTGKPRRWFEFRVTGPGIDYRYEGTPLPGPYFGSRSSHSVVKWEADSSAVRFVFPNAELRIGVRLPG